MAPNGLAKWVAKVRSCKVQIQAMAKVEMIHKQIAFRRATIHQLFEHARQNDDWETGDLANYTHEMLDLRASLRYHREVVNALEDWWRAMESILDEHGRRAGLLNRDQYLVVFTKVHLALYPATDRNAAMTSVLADWLVDSAGESCISREVTCDALFDLADHWTDEICGTDYAVFLLDALSCVWRKHNVSVLPDTRRQSTVHFRDVAAPYEVKTIEPRYLNDHGFELLPDDAIDRLPKREAQERVPIDKEVKSRYLQDAEDYARRRFVAALQLQVVQRVRSANSKLRNLARDVLKTTDWQIKRRLRASLGHEPSAAEVAAERDTELVLKVSRGLGRDPNPIEVVAAREASLKQRLNVILGRRPKESELAAARDEALKNLLTVKLGRPPTAEELAAARETNLKWRYVAKFGRQPEWVDMVLAREADMKLRLKAALGRVPNDAELALTREEDLRLRLKAIGGESVSDAQLQVEREAEMRERLRAELGRDATMLEAASARTLELKHRLGVKDGKRPKARYVLTKLRDEATKQFFMFHGRYPTEEELVAMGACSSPQASESRSFNRELGSAGKVEWAPSKYRAATDHEPILHIASLQFDPHEATCPCPPKRVSTLPSPFRNNAIRPAPRWASQCSSLQPSLPQFESESLWPPSRPSSNWPPSPPPHLPHSPSSRMERGHLVPPQVEPSERDFAGQPVIPASASMPNLTQRRARLAPPASSHMEMVESLGHSVWTRRLEVSVDRKLRVLESLVQSTSEPSLLHYISTLTSGMQEEILAHALSNHRPGTLDPFGDMRPMPRFGSQVDGPPSGQLLPPLRLGSIGPQSRDQKPNQAGPFDEAIAQSHSEASAGSSIPGGEMQTEEPEVSWRLDLPPVSSTQMISEWEGSREPSLIDLPADTRITGTLASRNDASKDWQRQVFSNRMTMSGSNLEDFSIYLYLKVICSCPRVKARFLNAHILYLLSRTAQYRLC
ncbi:hypothetical protein AB1Y20_017998 [Prymnesium parvum]|uniref:Uncharacterized protein n=1 Tax=Prymnesium parvum TaxID=97485 RepID=A0AB34JQX5_PRYPA